jgi:hypothetical protein
VGINSSRLVTTRLRAHIQSASANVVVDPQGVTHVLPGQGGVVTGIGLGGIAGRWVGDHVEPGVSLGHPDPAAYHAIRLLACAGNSVEVLSGTAVGARGIVFGKHGAVLAMFAPETLAQLAPGDGVGIDACGLGLADEALPDVTFHSCSPALFAAMAEKSGDYRLHIPVAAVLPSLAAAAGIGMPAAMFNMDMNTSCSPIAEMAQGLRFGDLVAVMDQDHRFGRQHRKGWAMVGIVSHGAAVGGGHGLGLTTLLTAPAERLRFTISDQAQLACLLPLPWERG